MQESFPNLEALDAEIDRVVGEICQNSPQAIMYVVVASMLYARVRAVLRVEDTLPQGGGGVDGWGGSEAKKRLCVSKMGLQFTGK